jgi:hypothetical protein
LDEVSHHPLILDEDGLMLPVRRIFQYPENILKLTSFYKLLLQWVSDINHTLVLHHCQMYPNHKHSQPTAALQNIRVNYWVQDIVVIAIMFKQRFNTAISISQM